MNHYIRYIIESFDFNTVKKDNKTKQLVNTAMDAAIEYKLNDIVNNILKFHKPTEDDAKWLQSQIGIYTVNDTDKLKKLIECCIKTFGNKCNLNWIDVSNITNMDGLFYNSTFNGNISKWDVSNVTVMYNMFCMANFNGRINNWNVSNVTDMSYMFQQSKFNQDISKWDVSNVTYMDGMFMMAKKFNQDISKWNIAKVSYSEKIFSWCPIKEEYKPIFKK